MIYIRADMNSIIATGHLMRCLSIADAIKNRGVDVMFIIADDNPVQLLQSRGYKFLILNSEWNSLDAEINQMISIIIKKSIKILLVDHYYVTDKYLSSLRKYVFVAYIDDINAFNYPIDLLICYTNYYKKFNYDKIYKKETASNILLLGPKYVPLRNVFHNCRKKSIKDDIENLLIMSGGTDPYGILGKILEQVKHLNFRQIYVICGAYNTEYETFMNNCSCYTNVYILKSVSNIENYMEEADLAISAAGSTMYELCAVGTPTISYTFADNQLNNAIQFEEDGIIPYAGDVRKDDVINNIIYILNEHMNDINYRKEISMKMQLLVDGKGAYRIADELINITYKMPCKHRK